MSTWRQDVINLTAKAETDEVAVSKKFLKPPALIRFYQVVNQAGVPTEYPLFALAEAIYMSWFTFELLIRLVS